MSTESTDGLDLVSTMEICVELDVDRGTLIRWVQSGIARSAMKLPGPNGAYLFERSEIERLRVLRGPGRKQMPKGLADSIEASA